MTNASVRRRALPLCIGLLALGMSAAAPARTQGGQFAVEEGGRATCASFVQAKAAKSPTYGRYIGFVEGYLTAANRYEANTFDLTPWHNAGSFALILDQHCRKNGRDVLVMAAQKLVLAMQPLRLSEHSNLIEVSDGKGKAYIYESVMKRAQTELTKKGLYRGAANGKYSPEVKSALQSFQKSAKLNPSGIPDPATLWVLLNP